MENTGLNAEARKILNHLCLEIPTRQVGSQGNRDATDYFACMAVKSGFQIERAEFDCIDWTTNGATLCVAGESYEVFSSPYSLGCKASAPIISISTLEELRQVELRDQAVLLRGEIAREQIMPKFFPFYNPDEHQEIIRLLETKAPQVILAATGKNPELVGALYPFPMFEDGDFDIPSVFMTEEQGERLAKQVGKQAYLESKARRIAAKGYNICARKAGKGKHRAALSAHIDARIGSPGALDNASGVVVLLLLAELLQDYHGELGIELLAFNGEDYYSAPGQMTYLQRNQGKMGDILLNINLDDVGYLHGKTGFSFYDCPDEIASLVRKTFASHQELVEGVQWYQGDHMIFVQNQVPALAITAENFAEAMREITHTARDLPEMVDPVKLASVALALKDFLIQLD